MAIYGKSIADYESSILQEAYYGRSPALQEAQALLTDIRANIKKYTDINRSKEVLAFNRAMEKAFGMEIFSLHIEQNDVINAYTTPVGLRFDVAKTVIFSKIVIADNNGMRFAPGNKLCIICTVYYGLLKNPDFTDEEIMAIILHELGHNFADAISKEIECSNKAFANGYLNYLILRAFLLITIPQCISAYRRNSNKSISKKESKTRKRRISGWLVGLKASCNDFRDYLSSIMYRIIFNKYTFNLAKKRAEEDGVIEKVKKSTGRQNEVIADKFAGIHGYGPEQASALLKMDKQITKAEQTLNKLKIPGILDGKKLNDEFNECFKDIYKFDCHPHTIQRLNVELNTLKKELEKSDLDPRLVDELKRQIKQLEDIKNEALKIYEGMLEDDEKRAAFYAEVDKLDPNALDADLEEAIDKAFDDYQKNYKKGSN